MDKNMYKKQGMETNHQLWMLDEKSVGKDYAQS